MKISRIAICLSAFLLMTASEVLGQGVPRPGAGWIQRNPIGTPNGMNVVLMAGIFGHVEPTLFQAQGNYMVTDGLCASFQQAGYNVYVVNIPEGNVREKGRDVSLLMRPIANHAEAINGQRNFIAICHSMGGLQIEEACLSHNCNQYFLKIITLDTPFYGSPAADYFVTLLTNGNFEAAAILITVLAEVLGGPLAASTIADLQQNVNSPAATAAIQGIDSLRTDWNISYQESAVQNPNYALYREKLNCIRAYTIEPEDLRYSVTIPFLIGTRLYGDHVGDGVVLYASQWLFGVPEITLIADHTQARTSRFAWPAILTLLNNVPRPFVRVRHNGPFGNGVYPTIADALPHLQTGGRLIIDSGVYNEAVYLSRPMRIESSGGLVRIIP